MNPVLEITMEALISRYDVLLFDTFGVLAGRYPHCNDLRFNGWANHIEALLKRPACAAELGIW